MKRKSLLLNMYHAMLGRLGPSGWWPGETPFEVAVGAILTQNTNWRNVSRAIANLKDGGVLDPVRLAALPPSQVEELIRPAGYFRLKAKRLDNFLDFLRSMGAMDPGLGTLARRDPSDLRPRLLAVKGIGPETADSILLYALNLPVFVCDAYTHRILNRHMLLPADAGYEEIRAFFEEALPADAGLYNEFHALIVRTAKGWCGKKQAQCPDCPLGDFLE